MGDRAYTRFSIPVHRLTPESHARISRIFDLRAKDLDVLQRPPEPLEAGYDNGVSFRMIQGCPCLVIEDDEANYAAAEEAEALKAAGIPFLRENQAGGQYGPSRMVFDGSDSMTIPLDLEGNAVVGVHIEPTGSVEVDEEELDDLRRFVATSMLLLKTR